MAGPPFAPRYDILINGVWTDISTYVYQRNPQIITRGRRSESSTSDTMTLTATVDNRTGVFDPNNPNGTWYGQISRNTYVRVSFPSTATPYMFCASSLTAANYMSAPDNSRLDITGDLDIRFDAWFSNICTPAGSVANANCVGKYGPSAGTRSYILRLDARGFVRLFWSADGTNAIGVVSTVPIYGMVYGRIAIRATLKCNNGSGGYTVTFYTAPQLRWLANPTFDTNVTDWFTSTGTLTWQNGIVNHGTGAAKLVSGAGSTPHIESGGTVIVPAVAGQIISCGMWMYSDTNRSIELKLNWYTSVGGYISTTTVQTTTVAANTWTFFGGQATAPATTGRVSLIGGNGGTPGAGLALYFDDCELSVWTQLDQIVTTAGTTSIFSGSSPAYICGWPALSSHTEQAMKVYGAQILNGICGPPGANPDFMSVTDGTTSVTDTAAGGNTWTSSGTGMVGVARDYRFYGQIADFTQSWDKTVKDIYTNISAAGPSRRMSQGSPQVQSAYYRGVVSRVAPMLNLVAYWPCEDLAGSTWIASGLTNNATSVIIATPLFGNDGSSFVCSKPLPQWTSGCAMLNVPSYFNTQSTQVRALMAFPAPGTIADGTVLFSVHSGGGVARTDVVYNAGGGFTMNWYDWQNNLLATNGPVAFGLDGLVGRVGLSFLESGGNITVILSFLQTGFAIGGTMTATLTTNWLGAISSVVINPGIVGTQWTMGHVTVQNTITSIFELASLTAAWADEYPTDRLQRICGEENIGIMVIGDTGAATFMGPQGLKSPLDLLREVEVVDNGILVESTDFFGFLYRTNRSMMNQSAQIALNFSAADMSSMVPTTDDANTMNDFVATRPNGSSFHYTQSVGTLNVNDPPTGVGYYSNSWDCNVYTDSMLGAIASEAVHLGTSNEPRYLDLELDLTRHNYISNDALQLSVVGAEIGDKVTISNPPSFYPPELISTVTIGYVETINTYQRTFKFTTRPGTPYNGAVWGDSTIRYNAYNSYLLTSAAYGDTALNTVTFGSEGWGHGSGNYDVMIGGERMTVTAVAAAGDFMVNGAFPSNITGWESSAASGTVGALSWDAAVFHTASGSAKFTCNGTGVWPGFDFPAPFIPVLPGERVTMTCWIRCSAAYTARIDMDFQSPAPDSVYFTSINTDYPALTPNTWTQLTVSGTVPAVQNTAMTLLPIIQITDTPINGTNVWLDDVTLTSDRRQILTVTRSVNGIQHAHAVNESINLFDARYWSQ